MPLLVHVDLIEKPKLIIVAFNLRQKHARQAVALRGGMSSKVPELRTTLSPPLSHSKTLFNQSPLQKPKT
jgi:hypothetical protein